MKIIIVTVIILLNISTITAQSECEKCEIQKITTVYKNVDNLNYQIINEFLCTFDKSCENNVEYSQWSNEMLFKVIENSTDLYFEVLENYNQREKDYLLKELESPIHDGIDIQIIYDNIKSSNAMEDIKNQYLNTLEILL